MTYKWFKWWTLLTLPLVVSPFVVVGVLFVEAYSESPEQIIASIPVVAFACILAYLSLAHLFNTSELNYDDTYVQVSHGPIPWRGTTYRLRDCEEFRADKIFDGRLSSWGLRIRFIDNSFDDLMYASSVEEAQAWARTLNEHLYFLKKRRRNLL